MTKRINTRYHNEKVGIKSLK